MVGYGMSIVRPSNHVNHPYEHSDYPEEEPMALPPVSVTIPIPGALWRRWKDLEPRVGVDLQALVPALLELYLDREDQQIDGLSGLDYQI